MKVQQVVLTKDLKCPRLPFQCYNSYAVFYPVSRYAIRYFPQRRPVRPGCISLPCRHALAYPGRMSDAPVHQLFRRTGSVSL